VRKSTDSVFIQVTGLHKELGGQHIHRGVDISVFEGETLVLLGASGEGKSVFLKQLLGLMRPTSGSIVIDGLEVSHLPERELDDVRRKMGILFQGGALFDSMDVAENVAFPLREHGEKDQAVIAKRVHECLDAVDLAADKHKLPDSLSGGMRKRVALARAMVSNPRCILYDEPTAGLDPVVSDSINKLIRRIQERLGVTSVVVTHDMKSANQIADRIAYLRHGKIYFVGTPEEFQAQAEKDRVIGDFVEGRSREES
jgi:phospholipid/cholesterol/gamma-HCH transport system ATP-binding protein